MNKQIPNTFWRFTKWIFAPHKGWLVLLISFASLAGFYGTINSYLFKLIIDTLAQTPNTQDAISNIFYPLILFILNAEIHNLTWRGISYVNLRLFPLIKNKVISEMFSYLHKQTQSFFQENLSGSLASKITSLAENMGRIFYYPAAIIIRGSVQFIIANVTMMFIHPFFSIALFLWASLFIFFTIKLSTKLRYLADNYASANTTLNGKVVDSLTNANTVRTFAQRRYEQSYLAPFLSDANNQFKKQEWYLIKLNIYQGISISILVIFIVFYLTTLVSRSLISVGDFTFILTLTLVVVENIWWITDQFDVINSYIGQSNQTLKTILVPIKIQDESHAKILKVVSGSIKFDRVWFQYSDKPLFQGLSVTIPAGQKVGLVGYSGSGKTTFLNLILRLFEIQSESIMIDGQNIKELSQDSLRNNIGMIPQEPNLFHRTLLENIRYGKPNATYNQIINASKKAFAHEFIIQLPDQYKTMVGERGIKLSGGQRQRIAIARAILKNAPILFLDEATSQLDSITESKIQQSTWHLMQGKTTIVIAHRLATLQRMDRIIVFNQGKIVEDGSHLKLVKNNGLYKSMWETQVGGFLPDKKTEFTFST